MNDQIDSILLRRFEILKKIGSGSYGQVWKVRDRQNNQPYALKKIISAFQHSTDSQRTYREIVFLRQMHHDNIIRLIDIYKASNDQDIYLLFEFVDTDLSHAIRNNKLQEEHIRFIMWQLVKAINYIHSGELLHRDLKPNNVLITADCRIKLCDFGLSRTLYWEDTTSPPVLTDYIATRWYRSPQVLLGSSSYGKAADIWSLGCILAQIILGRPIFPGTSTVNQLQRIMALTGRPCPEDVASLKSDVAQSLIDTIHNIKVIPGRKFFPDISDDLYDVAMSLLRWNPTKRYTAAELIDHPFFRQFREKEQPRVAHLPFRIDKDNKKLSIKEYKTMIYEIMKPKNNEVLKLKISQLNLDKVSKNKISEKQVVKNTKVDQKRQNQPNKVRPYQSHQRLNTCVLLSEPTQPPNNQKKYASPPSNFKSHTKTQSDVIEKPIQSEPLLPLSPVSQPKLNPSLHIYKSPIATKFQSHSKQLMKVCSNPSLKTNLLKKKL